MSITTNTFTRMFQEYYYINLLSEYDQIEYKLINRYWDKLGKKHHDRSEALFKEGKALFSGVMSNLVYKENPILKSITKDDNISNLYYEPILLDSNGCITFSIDK